MSNLMAEHIQQALQPLLQDIIKKEFSDFSDYLSQHLNCESTIIKECINNYFEYKHNTSIPDIQPKLPKNKLTIILNFTQDRHGIFGDKKITEKIGDVLRSLECKFNPKLSYGAGWTISQDRYAELVESLSNQGVAFHETELNKKVSLSPDNSDIVEISESQIVIDTQDDQNNQDIKKSKRKKKKRAAQQ